MASSVVLLISILLPFSLVLGDADLIQKVCKKTRFPNLCTSTLNHAQPNQYEIVKRLNIEMLFAGNVHAADTSRFILAELVKTVSDPAAVKAFKRCSEDYEQAKSDLDRSIQFFAYGDYKTALRYINFGRDHVDRCRDSFNPPLSYPDTLKQREVRFVELVTVAADIIKQQFLNVN